MRSALDGDDGEIACWLLSCYGLRRSEVLGALGYQTPASFAAAPDRVVMADADQESFDQTGESFVNSWRKTRRVVRTTASRSRSGLWTAR